MNHFQQLILEGDFMRPGKLEFTFNLTHVAYTHINMTQILDHPFECVARIRTST